MGERGSDEVGEDRGTAGAGRAAEGRNIDGIGSYIDEDIAEGDGDVAHHRRSSTLVWPPTRPRHYRHNAAVAIPASSTRAQWCVVGSTRTLAHHRPEDREDHARRTRHRWSGFGGPNCTNRAFDVALQPSILFVPNL